jgi:hypothetical protein
MPMLMPDFEKTPQGYFKIAENQPVLSAEARRRIADVAGVAVTFFVLGALWCAFVLLVVDPLTK